MHLTGLDYLAAGGAAAAAGAINALAGGGTLVSFPTLVGIGLPAVTANVTNTVALLPGYLGGSWAQRDDLRPQVQKARLLAAAAAAGGLAGSILLVTIPAGAFRVAVPYLILVSCALLLGQDWIRQKVGAQQETATTWGPGPTAAVFVAAMYGGFFGAGLGIVLLAIIGVFSAQPLVKTNALKQALSFVINLVAAVFFAASGKVRWEVVPVMAVAAVVGGMAGGRLAGVIPAALLRRVVVIAGVGVAIAFWVG